MPSKLTIFREEALDSHLRDGRIHGDLLRISPRWTRWTYWLLVVVFAAGSSYLGFGRIHEYATGVAVIRDEGRTMVTAITDGTIAAIAVRPGQRVEANQLLLHFNDLPEKIELEHLTQELNTQQINRLRNPNDLLAQQQLANARAQIEAAERRLKERRIFAPCAGIVRDLRIHSNQRVAPGELLLTIAGANEDLSVIAVLPGHYRPLLKPGHQLRLELAGFRYVYQRLTIDTIGHEVVGPGEVRRFLGQEIADSLTLQGSSVIVQAHLPSSEFYADGRWRRYHDGMPGTAEVRVRSERILFALAPGLRALWGGNDE